MSEVVSSSAEPMMTMEKVCSVFTGFIPFCLFFSIYFKNSFKFQMFLITFFFFFKYKNNCKGWKGGKIIRVFERLKIVQYGI